MTDTPSKPTQASKDALLGELESIKDLLEQQNQDNPNPSNIPTLDDIADKDSQQDKGEDNEGNNASQLLDLGSIFNDNEFGVEEDINSANESTIDFDDFGDFDDLDISISIPDFTLSATTQNNEQIEVDSHDETPAAANVPPQQNTDIKNPNVCIDLLIQEIVDEFIPTLEAQLRQRLSHYKPEVIRQLAKKHLKS